MTPYNEIFSLNQNGLNHSQIEKVLGGTVTRKTIISALRLADEYGFHYNPGSGLTDAEIHRILHPKKDKESRMPNMAQVLFTLSLPDQSVASVWKKYIHENPDGYSKTKPSSKVTPFTPKKETVVPKAEVKPTRPIIVGREIADRVAETMPKYGEKKPVEIPELHSGDKVRHKKFGDGTVISVEDAKFTVQFKEGIKTLGTKIAFENGIVTKTGGV